MQTVFGILYMIGKLIDPIIQPIHDYVVKKLDERDQKNGSNN